MSMGGLVLKVSLLLVSTLVGTPNLAFRQPYLTVVAPIQGIQMSSISKNFSFHSSRWQWGKTAKEGNEGMLENRMHFHCDWKLPTKSHRFDLCYSREQSNKPAVLLLNSFVEGRKSSRKLCLGSTFWAVTVSAFVGMKHLILKKG